MLESCLWSLACQSISLGNKANCLLLPTVFLEFLHSLPLASCFICLGHLVRLLTHSWVCQMKVDKKIPLVNFCVYCVYTSFADNSYCLCLPGIFHDGSKGNWMFYALYLSRESWNNTLNSVPAKPCLIFRQHYTPLSCAAFFFKALISFTRIFTQYLAQRHIDWSCLELLSFTFPKHIFPAAPGMWISIAPLVTRPLI